MRTAIIGLGVTGRSCLRFLSGRDDLLVVDTRPPPADAEALRAAYPQARFVFAEPDAVGTVPSLDFSGVDRFILSPGLPLDHCLARQAREAGADLVSDIDLFCAAVSEGPVPAPVYGITGTNGKSTVTELVGHLLAACGRRPGVGGNLGDAALDLLQPERDCYVLELSSFQLERMAAEGFAAATILNVTDDHLDRHGSMAAYAAAKQRIYADADRAVANREDPLTLPAAESGVRECVTFGLDVPARGHWGLREVDGALWLSHGEQTLLAVAELPLAGLHNAANVLAALALIWRADIDATAVIAALRTFSGLPHRCQRVAVIGGVSYVNDSKATNVGATLAALRGLAEPGRRHLVLVAGGDGKGADFSPLVAPVSAHVKAVVLLGRDAPRLQQTLEGHTRVVRVDSIEGAVRAARELALPGDVVLLSPACASLDMFANFAARGDAFAAAVRSLA
ncbi:MAG: UDP-N-acetylmuramoyl-L-alanine--D-glutamate ligase [Pseudomonadales bacterium]